MISRRFGSVLLIVCTTIACAAFADDGENIDYQNQNFSAVVLEYIMLAGKGDANAQIKLGDMYASGQGVPADAKEALKWYRRAAGRGSPGLQYYLGVKLATGQGLPQDYKEAIRWFKLSANQGHLGSQYNLGVIYAGGQVVPQDYRAAVKWFGLAAHQGYTNAQYNLGVMYEKGQGVDKPNNVAAYALYSLVASNDESIENLVMNANRIGLAEKMSAQEIDAAKALTRELSKKNNLLEALEKYLKSQH